MRTSSSSTLAASNICRIAATITEAGVCRPFLGAPVYLAKGIESTHGDREGEHIATPRPSAPPEASSLTHDCERPGACSKTLFTLANNFSNTPPWKASNKTWKIEAVMTEMM